MGFRAYENTCRSSLYNLFGQDIHSVKPTSVTDTGECIAQTNIQVDRYSRFRRHNATELFPFAFLGVGIFRLV
jgi:hypothetical protein